MHTEFQPGWSTGITVDLANTATASGDRLTTREELAAFLRAHGEADPVTVTDADLTQVRALRQRLRTVFEAGDPAAAAAAVNGLLDTYATRPYLTDHDGSDWHLHVSPGDATWGSWLAARTALALALVIAEGGFERLRVCAAHDCAVVLLDTSRNHTRRFCTPTCATRTRVAAHRARNRAPDS